MRGGADARQHQDVREVPIDPAREDHLAAWPARRPGRESPCRYSDAYGAAWPSNRARAWSARLGLDGVRFGRLRAGLRKRARGAPAGYRASG